MASKRVTRKVITGGPAAGKSTILAYLQQRLPRYGTRVFTVPEAARMLLEGGAAQTPVDSFTLQRAIIKTQLALEDAVGEMASTVPGRVVVLCDRGIMDNLAYDPVAFNMILEKMEMLRIPHLRDGRYDTVLHLVTAANGAQDFYVNDPARRETFEEACRIDQAIQDAWVGHPRWRLIDNSTGFTQKKKRVLREILHALGIPEPLEIERKFLVDASALDHLPGSAQTVDIEQVYLKTDEPELEERVRKRGQDGHYVYYHATKHDVRPGVRIEHEEQITEYDYLLLMQDRGESIVLKRRTYFVYDGQYLELDDYALMGLDLRTLEVEFTREGQELLLPDWLSASEEVTGKREYSNRNLAIPLST